MLGGNATGGMLIRYNPTVPLDNAELDQMLLFDQVLIEGTELIGQDGVEVTVEFVD
jgi:hypothetical protein